MRLHNEFTVDAPPERVWTGLLDIERVASCLPGAKIEAGDGELHRGSMRVKLGPMTTVYAGTARLGDVDEDARSASIEVKAKEARGQGTASATITNRLEPVDGAGTRVIAETELQVTGRQAQFGRGIMQDVASSMLDEFARRFEQELLRGPEQPRAEPAGAGAAGPRAGDDAADTGAADDEADVLDAGAVLAGMARRYVAVAGAVGAAVLAIALARTVLRRRRSTISLRFEHRW